MKDEICSFLKRILRPPGWWVFLAAALTALFMFQTFCMGRDTGWFTYVGYLFCAYALVIFCERLRLDLKTLRVWLSTFPLLRRIWKDLSFRTRIMLIAGILIDTLYALTNLASGIRHGAVWFWVLGIYYLLLALIRIGIFWGAMRSDSAKAALQRSRRCGIVLLVMNLILFYIVVLVLQQAGGFSYDGMTIYAEALYAFYAVTAAVVRLVRYRKSADRDVLCANVVCLFAGLISLLALEIAMLARFGSGIRDGSNTQMLIATAAGICAVYVLTCIRLIRGRTFFEKC
ncbi:MAG: hypothetical protein ACI4OJ_09930 [Lachnospiraceae bacterium]